MIVSRRFLCGVASNRLVGVIGLNICAWPLAQVRLEDRLIEVGPCAKAFAAASVAVLAALLAWPVWGLVALIVLPIVYLTIPRWRCDLSELTIRRGSLPGTITSFVLAKASSDTAVGIWLPQSTRLSRLLEARGISIG